MAKYEQGKAPRVTLEMVIAEIVAEDYVVTPSGRTTICELTLKNGFTVLGESSVCFLENNVPELGRKYARANAVDQVWMVLGFRLMDEEAAK